MSQKVNDDNWAVNFGVFEMNSIRQSPMINEQSILIDVKLV
jgi:hypothetical protein